MPSRASHRDGHAKRKRKKRKKKKALQSPLHVGAPGFALASLLLAAGKRKRLNADQENLKNSKNVDGVVLNP